MRKRKSYKPHCPSAFCSGGNETRLEVFPLENASLPPGTLLPKHLGEDAYRCRHCGLIWSQKHRQIGFMPNPIGYWDDPNGPPGFSSLGKFFEVRRENKGL